MVNILSYLPGGGGNHLKNIINLDGRFNDQWPWDWVKEQSINLENVYSGIKDGTAHTLPGRNLHEVFVEHAWKNPGRDYLLHGHFGELAQHRDIINSIETKKILLLSIDQTASRNLVRHRQKRLGQNIHPYWINEEQMFLYQPTMYTTYFNCDPADILTVELCDFWQRDLRSTGIIPRLEDFFNCEIDEAKAQEIHEIWVDSNNFKGNK